MTPRLAQTRIPARSVGARPWRSSFRAAVAALALLPAIAAHAGDWTLFSPVDSRFVALGGTPRFEGLLIGYTLATTAEGTAVQPYVTLDNGQRWRRATPLDAEPSSRRFATLLAGGTTPVLYVELADRLLRSDDQASTWVPIASGSTPRLAAVNPLDGNDVYAIVGGTLQHSLDGGASWSAIGPAGATAASVDWYARVAYVATADGNVTSINLVGGATINTVVIPNAALSADGNLVFAINTGNVYRSIDNGKTWQWMLLEAGQLNAAGVAFAPSVSGFAYLWESAGGGRRLWRTPNRGDTWTMVATAPCACEWTSVVVSSLDANVIVAATTGGTFLSTDGGVTFATPSPLLGAPGGPVLGILSDPNDFPSKWLVTPRGPLPPLATQNGGTTWLPVNGAPDGDVPRPIFVHPELSGHVIAQGNARAQGTSVWTSSDAGNLWKSELAFGGAAGAAVAAVIVGNQPTDLLLLARVEGAGAATTEARASSDAGYIWAHRPAPALAVRAAVRTSAGILAGGDDTGSGTLFRSVDDGASWQPLAVPFDADVAALAVAKSSPGRVYLGTRLGGAYAVFASVDGGLTWTPASRMLGAGPVASIAVHPLQPDHVAIAQPGDGVFRTTDAGATWLPLDAGLHGVAVESVAFDVKLPRYLYVGSETGLFRADLDTGAPTGVARAYEYYYPPFDHYFATSDPVEVDGLDRGIIGGWERTGAFTRVEPTAPLPRRPVCRFYGSGFAPKSSHFYTPYADECESLKGDPKWVYEGIAFGWRLPDANGRCNLGFRPLYRLYNDFAGGAPNHRYTTSLRDFYAMLDAGWVFEGDARTLVFGCVPI
jgi:photosystem II stability/assembly factor-like uncharacterized protein